LGGALLIWTFGRARNRPTASEAKTVGRYLRFELCCNLTASKAAAASSSAAAPRVVADDEPFENLPLSSEEEDIPPAKIPTAFDERKEEARRRWANDAAKEQQYDFKEMKQALPDAVECLTSFSFQLCFRTRSTPTRTFRS
jgi:hypothetical protein